jgi:hypothetical protein
MKTKAIAAAAVVAVLIAGAVLSLAVVLYFQPRVEITSFGTTGTASGSSIGGVNVRLVLNLTNTGSSDAKNLTVTFSTNSTIESQQHLIHTNSTSSQDHISEFEMGEPCYLGDLKAEETKNFTFYWAVSVGFDAPPLTATLKTNEVTLDQATTTIPPIPNAKITNFVCLGIWHGTAAGGLLDLFSLNYTNLGTTDVKGLTVTLNTSKTDENYTDPRHNTSNPNYNPYYFLDEIINGEKYPLESLKAKETKTFERSYFDVGFLLILPFELTATLKSNDTILDQATITIPISNIVNISSLRDFAAENLP